MSRVSRLAHSPRGTKLLEDLGIVTEMTGYRRNRRFSYDAYIQLFADPVPGQTETTLP